MKNIDWHTGNPKVEGFYLCKVEGLRFSKYATMRWSDGYWWSYFTGCLHDGKRLEGWCGAEAKVIEWTLIEELKD